MERARKILRRLGLVLVIVFALYYFSLFYPAPGNRMVFGASFDPVYARYLGLDIGQTFATILDDWRFRHIRLGLHWDAVEKQPGQFDFRQFDALMDMAAARGAQVVLAIGQKTPRWPECHIPAWAMAIRERDSLNHQGDFIKARAEYIAAAVEHYKNHPALELWQVENEPFLGFGDCPAFSNAELKNEIALVRSLDGKHPILITDSGELSTWIKTAGAGDYFGTTLYRVVWNTVTGYWSYDWLPAWFYRAKLAFFGRSRSQAFVIELQGEPWLPAEDVFATPLDEQFKSLNLTRLKNNIDFARRVDFARSYLWGTEWWVWLAQKKDHPEFAEFIRTLPKQ